MTGPAAGSDDPVLHWETAIPLLTNRSLVAGMAKVVCLAATIMGALLTLILASQGEWKAIGPLWVVLAIAGAAIMLLMLLVMLVVFRNRMRVRYRVAADGVAMETIDPIARRANRLAIVAGLVTGRMQAAGAGLIGVGREHEAVHWGGAFKARFDAAGRTITFASAWRRLMVVHCTPENYDAVAAIVRERMARSHTASRVPGRSPLVGYVGWTTLVVLACVPSFLAVEPFAVSLLLPILLLCFAVATVWLVPFFGYVIIGASTLIAGSVAFAATTVHESMFRRGEHYAQWTVWDRGEWTLVALEAVSLAFLCWFAVRAIRGRIRVALIADDADRGG